MLPQFNFCTVHCDMQFSVADPDPQIKKLPDPDPVPLTVCSELSTKNVIVFLLTKSKLGILVLYQRISLFVYKITLKLLNRLQK